MSGPAPCRHNRVYMECCDCRGFGLAATPRPLTMRELEEAFAKLRNNQCEPTKFIGTEAECATFCGMTTEEYRAALREKRSGRHHRCGALCEH